MYKLTDKSPLNRSSLLITLGGVALAGIMVAVYSHAAKPPAGGGGGGKPTVTNQLYLSPAKSTVAAGQTFTVQVHSNSGSTQVNAVQADLSYPADKLDFVSIDDSASAYQIKAIGTGASGTVHIARGTTTPVTGDQLVATINFVAKPAKGNAAVSFLPTSALVTADTHTNMLTSTAGGTYSLGK